MGEISAGLCQCGCGKTTTIAAQTDRKLGHIKGQPKRFVQGHRRTAPLNERFWLRVNKNGPVPNNRSDLGPCWIWIGSLNDQEYGIFLDDDGKDVRAHRQCYEMVKGPIPDGHQLDHLCRVRPCVNPDHLEAVTPTVNKLRGEGWTAINARKTHCPEGHPLVEGNLAKWHLEHGQRKCLICSRTKAAEGATLKWKTRRIVQALLSA